MSYKVDYDALDTLCGTLRTQTDSWQQELGGLQDRLKILMTSENMTGSAAESYKNYLETVHTTILGLISTLVSAHISNVYIYKSDYQLNVDTGLHTIILKEELNAYSDDVEKTRKKAVSIQDSLGYVLSGISDIFRVSYRDVTDVDTAHAAVVSMLNELDEAVESLEDKHYQNDFVNTGDMITSLKAVINEQLSKERTFRTQFDISTLANPNWQGLINAHTNITAELESKEKLLEEAIANEEARIKAFEEEKEDRKWIKWVAVGIAVVGSVVLIAVTAGGATPLVCAGVGAAVGVTTAAANNFADNYVENGSLTEGMDWSEFGKDCVVGAVTGAISGYLGATATGSCIKQPIKSALRSAGTEMLKSGAEGLINTTWEVGEAIITKKPGDEIVSVLKKEAGDMFKDIAKEGTTGFVGGYIGGKFAVDPSDAGFAKKLGQDTVKNAAEAVTKSGVDSAWDIGAAALDPESSKNMSSVLKEEACDFLSGAAEEFVKNEFESVIGGANDAYQKSHKDQSTVMEVITNAVAEGVGGGGGSFAGGVAEQGVEVLFDEREGFDFKEVWDDEMDGGRIFVKKAAEAAGKEIVDAKFKDQSFRVDMERKDYNHDGKVDVVVFDKYMVLREDYEAAREVAGKGAYKDMSAQDILGLPKNAKISEKNMEYKSISIKRLEESDFKGRKDTNVTRIDYKSDNKKLYTKPKK